MKGIETRSRSETLFATSRSDHCPAMKGIETIMDGAPLTGAPSRSDHCPAMKGIETLLALQSGEEVRREATTAPQ